MTHHLRVGVVRGGPSNEYEVSLQSGAAVLNALRSHHAETHRAHDIFIDRHGVWHMEGVEISPADALSKVDVIFNALHGAYGEDGKIQALLEARRMPFTGSESLPSALGMNKSLSKNIFRTHGIQTPSSREFTSEEIVHDANSIVSGLFLTVLLPVIVKPVSAGSSVGVSVVRSYAELAPALRSAAEHDNMVMVEEFIPGIEATCAVVENFRGHSLYALPPIEIRPHQGIFSYEAKYQGKSKEIVPSTFSHEVKMAIEGLARAIHSALGLRHYSRSDFIVHPRRGIYALEANTLPGLTDESLVPKALRAVGSDVPEFVAHVLALAHERP